MVVHYSLRAALATAAPVISALVHNFIVYKIFTSTGTHKHIFSGTP